jgi:hypothetical protein
MTIKEWLDTPCKDEELSYIKDGDRDIAYIPIGIIERILDEKFEWDTSDFKFSIAKTGSFWFATGSVLLTVRNSGSYIRSITGAATIRISSKDENMHYEATVLSLAISNAASRLGRRFGRHLNDRMVTGETSFVETKEPEMVDIKKDRLLLLIKDANTPEVLANYKSYTVDDPEIRKAYMDRLKQLTPR